MLPATKGIRPRRHETPGKTVFTRMARAFRKRNSHLRGRHANDSSQEFSAL
nr:MAG TPA: hypothetical protein [Caudoviricetes sp.]